MSQLELVGVSKFYGSAVAVDNISIKFNDKGYICLLGPLVVENLDVEDGRRARGSF
ncbi:MAG: hypothetical protein CM15mP54_28140 [Paracoccaceae bacterium]|nr:MAG: hypothetical protein CM15mP54_28140 [Paracoccaceae bacterium]